MGFQSKESKTYSMFLYAGRSRQDLEPTPADRRRLRSKIEPFAEADYVLKLYFGGFFIQDTHLGNSRKGTFGVYLKSEVVKFFS